jgi:hypothetical protein
MKNCDLYEFQYTILQLILGIKKESSTANLMSKAMLESISFLVVTIHQMKTS